MIGDRARRGLALSVLLVFVCVSSVDGYCDDTRWQDYSTGSIVVNSVNSKAEQTVGVAACLNDEEIAPASRLNMTNMSGTPHTLNLNNCNLDCLPLGLLANEALINLSHIVAHRNLFTHLGIDNENNIVIAQRLEAVRIIDVDQNNIVSIAPTFLANAKVLVGFSAAGNFLTRIPTALFATTTSLEVLTLDANRIAIILVDAFNALSKLKHLSLANNKLRLLAGETLTMCTSLMSLSLDNNFITLLPDDLLLTTILLEEFHARDNALTTIPRGLFDATPHLRTLSIGGNALTTFDPLSYPFISHVQLGANPINCKTSRNATFAAGFEINCGSCFESTLGVNIGVDGTIECAPFKLKQPGCGVSVRDRMQSAARVVYLNKALVIDGFGAGCSATDAFENYVEDDTTMARNITFTLEFEDGVDSANFAKFHIHPLTASITITGVRPTNLTVTVMATDKAARKSVVTTLQIEIKAQSYELPPLCRMEFMRIWNDWNTSVLYINEPHIYDGVNQSLCGEDQLGLGGAWFAYALQFDGEEPGTDIFTNTMTGRTLLTPTKLGNYPVTLRVAALDLVQLSGLASWTKVGHWTLSVLERPSFELTSFCKAQAQKLVDDVNSVVRYVNESFSIRGMDARGCDIPTAFVNAFDDDYTAVRYGLSHTTAMETFINQGSSAISATAFQAGVFELSLYGMDGGGRPILVANFTIEVIQRDSFALKNSTCGETFVQQSQALTRKYDVNSPVVFAGINGNCTIDNTFEHFRDMTTGEPDVVFSIMCRTNGGLVSDDSCSLNKFSVFDSKTSRMSLNVSVEGNFTFEIFARSGVSPIFISSFTATFAKSDLEFALSASNGKLCTGRGRAVDLIKQDGSITCECFEDYSGEECEEGHPNGANVTVILAVVFVLVLVIGVVGFWRYRVYAKHKQLMAVTDFAIVLEKLKKQGNLSIDVGSSDAKFPRELPRSCINLVKVIGSGAFGDVWKATLDESKSKGGGPPEYLVAAKTVRDAQIDSRHRDDLVSEAALMAQVSDHRNVVALIGVCTAGSPVVLVLSYCEYGSLLDVVQGKSHEDVLTPVMKLTAATEIASGMAHLTKQKFVHRDLAARNVLVATGMVCKIADFGLSRKGRESEGDADGASVYYRCNEGTFALRWASPEVLQELKFSAASDVWAFGVTLIEIYTDGGEPFHGCDNSHVSRTILAGKGPPTPHWNTGYKELYALCCTPKPADRPTFDQVFEILQRMLAAEAAISASSAVRTSDGPIKNLQVQSGYVDDFDVGQIAAIGGPDKNGYEQPVPFNGFAEETITYSDSSAHSAYVNEEIQGVQVPNVSAQRTPHESDSIVGINYSLFVADDDGMIDNPLSERRATYGVKTKPQLHTDGNQNKNNRKTVGQNSEPSISI
eukprot:m.122095 g.122095  ORF g.122095 m.122095 type:complete len:1389 (+) comp28900_c0_seq2:179-4345(+)